MNIAVVQGSVRATPDERRGRDGSLLVSFDVVIEGSPNVQVPVTWIGPDHKVPKAIAVGRRVTVIGAVHRRFYRRGGSTLSRTDVRAERVISGVGQRATAAVRDALEHQLAPTAGSNRGAS